MKDENERIADKFILFIPKGRFCNTIASDVLVHASFQGN